MEPAGPRWTKLLALLVILAACGDNLTPPEDANLWSGWGRTCKRPIYGAIVCDGPDGLHGWCVTFDNADRCMPACFGVNYECEFGTQHFNEGNECFCAMNKEPDGH